MTNKENQRKTIFLSIFLTCFLIILEQDRIAGQASLRISAVMEQPTNRVANPKPKSDYVSTKTSSAVVAPLISLPDGDYWDSQTIELTHRHSAAKIYYTLDDSEPDKNSRKYNTPILIDKNTRIKAIAYIDGEPSKPITRELAIRTWAATATEFKLAGENDVKNVKIHWEQRPDVEHYKIYRDGNLIGESTGDVFDDYNLDVGKTYTYYVEGYQAGQKIATSLDHQATPFTHSEEVSVYENSNGNGGGNSRKQPDGIKVGDQYYRYSIRRQVKKTEEGTGTQTVRGRAVYELVSPNGLDNWTSRELAFYPHPANFEGVSTQYNKKTGKVVIVAHYEDAGGYVAAKLYLAQITPGGGLEVTFDGRPLGFESRDQSIFIDDDHTAYILSATNMNEDVNIYQLDETWSKPIRLVNTVFKGQHRETPYITKKDSVYYFFSSKASGWYPSQAMYASATDLAGVWTQKKEVGNNSSFGSQVNSVSSFGSKRSTYGMYSYRWGAQYHHSEKTGNFPRILFVNFNNGYASMEYYARLETHEEYGLIPVQAGRNLTLGKPVKATSTDEKYAPAAVVTDGADLDSSPFFKGRKLPYSLTVDMEQEASIAEINLATRLTGGSETAYKYTIEASADGKTYHTIVDNLNNWKVGFHILKIADENPYRYLRLNVHDIVNVHNEQRAEWADGIFELTAFGEYK